MDFMSQTHKSLAVKERCFQERVMSEWDRETDRREKDTDSIVHLTWNFGISQSPTDKAFLLLGLRIHWYVLI